MSHVSRLLTGVTVKFSLFYLLIVKSMIVFEIVNLVVLWNSRNSC